MGLATSDPREQARRAVAEAVKDGRLVRPRVCSRCGREAVDRRSRIEGHHHLGYDHPHRLDVEWLCVTCHGDVHMAARTTWASLRVDAGRTLRQVEVLSGLNRGIISQIERGRACATPDQATAILDVYRNPTRRAS